MTPPEKPMTEQWIEILRAGRVLPRGAGAVTEETLLAMAAAFVEPIPVGHGYDALTERVPAPAVGFVHALEVRRDDRGMYLAGLLQPSLIDVAKHINNPAEWRSDGDGGFIRIELPDPPPGMKAVFSPAWIASGHAAATIVHVAMGFEALEPAQAADTVPRDEIVAAPTIVCALRIFEGLDPSRECGGRSELSGIERLAIASASPRPGRDGRAVVGDRYVGPQAAHYICQACHGRTIVELHDGTGSPHRSPPVEARELHVAFAPFTRGMRGIGLGGLVDGVVCAAVEADRRKAEERMFAETEDRGEFRLARRDGNLFGSFHDLLTGAGLVVPRGTNPYPHLSPSFVDANTGASIFTSTTRDEKSKYGRAPRQVRQDRNSKARAKILAKAAR